MCVPRNSTADSPQRDAVRFLSLVVLMVDSHLPSAAPDRVHQRTILRGLGVIDSFLSSRDQTQQDGEQVVVAFKVVPVYVTVAPWVPQLPPRLRTLVCDQGHLASLEGGRGFGSADVGPVPEGYLTREAVALVHGLPRCCVEAVSGLFPLFHPLPPTKTACDIEAAEATGWRLLHTEDAKSSTRIALMKDHLEKLALFREARLSTVMDSLLNGGASHLENEWVVVTYPDGLPPIPERARDVQSERSPARKGRRTTKYSDCHPPGTEAAEETVSPSPLFLLPARFLCQYFHIGAGWQRIAQQDRGAALDAVVRLREIIEAIPVCNGDGSVMTAKVVFDLPRGGKGSTVTLARASAM
ncbi:hypothetical protein ABB37_02682 [Leptomonas pyrrhocoris]|uniref:Uncharacterized protein n=1 Tax=Leptomonas pyrrhocoris TaxID=157538 RepID=A0A0M9G5T1_LEPPY|nr:hypothetical protein ABB37_02682 [Leptomonas pyrrhocoris]KPA82933.1 hypothetical protein ABB37_02682 [Leptomonas pyrrhocoris]|eukprot:XP_015661372.1 hypothetical protein ABB37_02682 [Leptomonas pyrrhocoris]